MLAFDLEQVFYWITALVGRHSPDVVVLCGNHAFRWYASLRRLTPNEQVEFVHPNALDYLELKDKRVLLVADETEYGRTLYEAAEMCKARDISQLRAASVFVNNSRTIARDRAVASSQLERRGEFDAMIAYAFKRLHAWKRYSSSADFHREVIIELREYMRRATLAPFNADATLLHLKTAPPNDISSVLARSLKRRGWWYRPSRTAATFVCQDFVPSHYLWPLTKYIECTAVRSLLKAYAVDQHRMVISPMVHCRMEFPDGAWPRSYGNDRTFLSTVLGLGREHNKSGRERARWLSRYDLVSFCMDIMLFTSSFDVNPDLEVVVDEDSLICYYGQALGRALAEATRRELQSMSPELPFGPEDQEFATPDDAPEVDLNTLMAAKAATHARFHAANRRVRNRLRRRRAGLSAPEIAAAIGADDRTVTSCIDVLTELEWAYPVNRLVASGTTPVVERCYNTTHSGITGLMSRIIRVLRSRQIPTTITVLNKCTSFVTVMCLAEQDDIKTNPYLYGKQACFKLDDFQGEIYLDRFFEITKDTFERNGDKEYVLRSGVDARVKEECFNMIAPERLDALLEKFVEIFEQFVDLETRGKSELRRVDALAVFVDMLGSGRPEAGFRTLGVNLKHAVRDARAGKFDSALRVLRAMKAKVDLYKKSEATCKAVWQFLYPKAELTHVNQILTRYAALPNNSPLYSFITQAIKKAINDCESGRTPAWLDKLARLMCVLGGQGTGFARPLALDKEVSRFIVSADMRGSKELAKTPFARQWSFYAQDILSAWAWWFDGEFINNTGDEGIYAFSKRESALGFAGVVWVHLNGLSLTMCPSHPFGVGIAEGRIIAQRAGGHYSVKSGASVPFEPIARACGLSKQRQRILLDDGGGKTHTELTPHELFDTYVAKPILASMKNNAAHARGAS